MCPLAAMIAPAGMNKLRDPVDRSLIGFRAAPLIRGGVARGGYSPFPPLSNAWMCPGREQGQPRNWLPLLLFLDSVS